MFLQSLLLAIVAWSSIDDRAMVAGQLPKPEVWVEGIGYREPALQVPKTENFVSEEPKGINWASWAGGTNIYIKSPFLQEDPNANTIIFEGNDGPLKGRKFTAPPLTEDDNFNSNAQLGVIAYRIPSIYDLVGTTPDSDLAAKLDMTERHRFIVHIDVGGQLATCPGNDQYKCAINYQRQYTPVLTLLSPPVVFDEMITEMWFDPKSTMSQIKNLKTDEMPFVNMEIGGSKLDFEFFVEPTSGRNFRSHRPQVFSDAAWVKGRVGQMPIGHDKELKMLWEIGYSQVSDARAKHCSLDMKRCYYAMNVPVIHDISQNKGYITGGQRLTITGFGFDNGTVSVKVGDIDCKVTSVNNDQITCETKQAPEPTFKPEPKQDDHDAGKDDAAGKDDQKKDDAGGRRLLLEDHSQEGSTVTQHFVGGHGLLRRLYNSSAVNIYNVDKTKVAYTEHLMTQFDVPVNEGENLVNDVRGWFIAPMTAKYKFHITCDDYCDLHMGLDPKNPLKSTHLTERKSWTYYREFYRFSVPTKEVDLEKGQKYYIRGRHEENGGGDHFTAAVEIVQSEIKNHPNTMKEIQSVYAGPKDFQKEKWTLTILDIESNKDFYLHITKPDGEKANPIKIGAKPSEWELRNALISYYYWNLYYSRVGVERDILDEDDKLASETGKPAKKYVYTITVTKLYKGGETWKKIDIIPPSLKSNIVTERIQKSSSPIQGNYRIMCPVEGNDKVAKPMTTRDLNYGTSLSSVQYWLMVDCPGLHNNIEIFADNDDDAQCAHWENCISYFVRFLKGNGPQVQMKVLSGLTRPLSCGDKEAQGEDKCVIEYSQKKEREASTNLFYESIPFEWIRTYETKPQVTVNVGEYPAVCKNFTCSYEYVEAVGEVTSFTFTEGTKELKLVGTKFPKDVKEVQQIEFAQSYCTVKSISETEVTCTLDHDPVCGEHVPKIFSIHGQVKNSDKLVAQKFSCKVTLVSPSTDLNLLGGDNLTFTGSLLPRDVAQSTIEINFDDDTKTTCKPQASTSNSLICMTLPFSKTVKSEQTIKPTIKINKLDVDNSLTMTMGKTYGNVQSITPSSVNPTLKTKVTIKLADDFPEALNRADFSVSVQKKDEENFIREMNVIGVDNGAKTLICMFGGGWGGLYNVVIRHKKIGLLNTDQLTLDAKVEITSVSPNAGSIFGGTLLTIKGTNFGKEKTDNPVQIRMAGPRGVNCYVQSIKQTELTCRVGPTNEPDGQAGEVVVFLKTQEEAKCKDVCKWSFTDKVPEVGSISTIWDTKALIWTVEILGQNFGTSTEGVELLSDGRSQKLISVEDGKAVFQVTDIVESTLKNMQLFFGVGIPKNYDTIIQGKQLKLEPKLKKITPNSGSLGGTMITATIEGFGVSENPFGYFADDWFDYEISLINFATGENICKSTKIEKYGELQCHTQGIEIPEGTEIGFNRQSTQQKVKCDNYGSPDWCKFKQVKGDPFPVATEIESHEIDHIEFTGTNFLSADCFTAHVSYGGAVADKVEVKSDKDVLATWKYGLPPIGEKITPQLWFDKKDSKDAKCSSLPQGSRYYTKVEKKLIKELKVNGASDGLKCSFAGGCDFQIQADGLSTILSSDPKSNYISVCDDVCEFSSDNSNFGTAHCKVPKMSTVYSNDKFQIEPLQEDLKFAKYEGNFENMTMINDNHLTMMPILKSNAKECIFGGHFRENHIGLLDQVRWFFGDLGKTKKTKYYVDKMKFQGSQDGTTWTDLFAIDENAHEGWNYFSWEQAERPKFRFYRFYNADKQGCKVGEMKMTGVETVNSQAQEYTCPVKIQQGGKVLSTLTQKVTYRSAITPLLKSISPRFGTVTGGTIVTFTGEDFSDQKDKYTIMIDKRECEIQSATATSVTCKTADRPGLVKSSLEILIDGKGLVSNQQKLFRYVSMWSDDTTWGGEFAPMHMESIHVPTGLNLFVDVDSTPLLNLVMVEGSIIFAGESDPNHERNFDARYIFLNHGYMEVGTEEFPYTSKLTITMHGNVSIPFIPIFGNKVIAVKHSTLEMHGLKRTPTWTVMDETAEAGADVIKLSEPVDWQPGEQIAIASTSYNGREGEKRFIKSVDPTKKIITLTEPLAYKHFAMIQKFGDGSAKNTIDTRAEVGLLTRNIKFRGDPETSSVNQYGAAIFLHSEGDDSVIARLEYVELTDVGQAFKIGRYAVHFHMIGAVHKSYCRGNAVHQGFNRAFTLHGTNYLNLKENVAYDVKGHTIFIEDAVEKYNIIEKNLVMMTKRSWSLLNTDQTPACYWITNPQNNFYDNRCGGSDRYGYWYDLQTHAIGPHADTNVCPEYERVGEFKNNHAHSCGRYGLRIFHNMIPRKYPCQPIPAYDKSRPDDPYWKNPAITAHFYGLTSWKNGRNGAIAEKVGDVRFHDFKISDNLLAGVEFSDTDAYGDNTTRLDDSLIIGRSKAMEGEDLKGTFFGVIGPRSENLRIDNCRFFNYDFDQAAALSSCSHCFHPASTDHDGRTIRTSGLFFDSASVKRKILLQFPYKTIWLDEDSSLTGLGKGSWATGYFKHLEQEECKLTKEFDDAPAKNYMPIYCDNTIQIRRILLPLGRYKSPSSFFNQGFRILKFDDDQIAAYKPNQHKDAQGKVNMTLKRKEYMDDKEEYGVNLFQQTPFHGWSATFVTGHKYKVHFGKHELDWENAWFQASWQWQDWDKSIHLVNRYTEDWYDIKYWMGNQNHINQWQTPNNTIPASKDKYVMGQNLVQNQTAIRESQWIMNGKNRTGNKYDDQLVTIYSYRCGDACNPEIKEKPQEDRIRRWSVANDWKSEENKEGGVPKEGGSITIESGWNMVFDLDESPIYDLISVNGKLSFDETKSCHLRGKHIFVRAGELHIGSKEKPYQHKATITLYGEKRSATIVYDSAIEAGNKVIANNNVIRMFGKKAPWKMTRLAKPALKDDDHFYVEKINGLTIQTGDRLGLYPTSFEPLAVDDVIVKEYNPADGKVTITLPLKYYHWGAPKSTADKYDGLDIRGEVAYLTRNILIKGQNIERWGGQIVTSDTVEVGSDGKLVNRYGSTIMDSVEIYNCSQLATHKAALRFDGATELYSSITNSAIHNGESWGININLSQNIFFKNNIVFKFKQFGLIMKSSKNITIDDNIIGAISTRDDNEASHGGFDPEGVYSICSMEATNANCKGLLMRNNIAAGGNYGGFLTHGHDCDDHDGPYVGNVAHSIQGVAGMGLYMKRHAGSPGQNGPKGCTEFSKFMAYKNAEFGAFAQTAATSTKISHMVLVDNRYGMMAYKGVNSTATENPDVEMHDIKIYGESESEDCPQDKQGGFCYNIEKAGMMSSVGMWGGKAFMETQPPMMPMHNFMANSNWKTNILVKRVHFIDFKAKTRAGEKQQVIVLAPHGSDFIPPHVFQDCVFDNIEENAFTFFYEPPQKWAVIDDCGAFPCTGPKNTIFHMKNTQFKGAAKPSFAMGDFQIIPATDGFSKYIPGCTEQSSLNLYTCQQDKLGILEFESLDDDKWDRSMQPIYTMLQGSSIRNKLNSYMDHIWDGFYTGQVRLSRFPSIVYAPPKAIYDIEYTGTPAKNQRFTLFSQDPTLGMTVRIAYPSAESRQIIMNGKRKDMNAWDKNDPDFPQSGMYGAIKQTECGENRFIGTKNILEFYLTAGCELTIAPRDAVQTLTRMEWSMDEFFNAGGTTKFVDRVAGSLGIPSFQIKVVSVYEGSTIVVYDIYPDENDPEAQKSLDAIQKKQIEAFVNGKMDLGSPILDVQVKRVSSKDTKGADDKDSKPVDIIKDGNVVAPGFDQISALVVVIIVLATILVVLLIGILIKMFCLEKIMAKLGMQKQITTEDVDEKATPKAKTSFKVGPSPKEDKTHADDENQIPNKKVVEDATFADEFRGGQESQLDIKGKDLTLRPLKLNDMVKSVKIPIEKVEAADHHEDGDTSQSSSVGLVQEALVMEKIDMRGVFRVNGALITYSCMSSAKGYTFSMDVKTSTDLEKLFKKAQFAAHVEHSAHGKLRKTGSMRITCRKIIKTIHEQFREEIESLAAVIIEEGKEAEKWCPTLKQAIADKFLKK